MPGASRGSGCGCPMPVRLPNGRTPAQTGSNMSALSSIGGPERHLAETSDSVSETTDVAVSSGPVAPRACAHMHACNDSSSWEWNMEPWRAMYYRVSTCGAIFKFALMYETPTLECSTAVA